MGKTRKKWQRRDWVLIFQEYEQSGKSAKEFCREHKISRSLFYRRRQEQSQDIVSKPRNIQAADFIRLPGICRPPASAAIVFPGSVELLIYPGCDIDLVRQLIGQLREVSC